MNLPAISESKTFYWSLMWTDTRMHKLNGPTKTKQMHRLETKTLIFEVKNRRERLKFQRECTNETWIFFNTKALQKKLRFRTAILAFGKSWKIEEEETNVGRLYLSDAKWFFFLFTFYDSMSGVRDSHCCGTVMRYPHHRILVHSSESAVRFCVFVSILYAWRYGNKENVRNT